MTCTLLHYFELLHVLHYALKVCHLSLSFIIDAEEEEEEEGGGGGRRRREEEEGGGGGGRREEEEEEVMTKSCFCHTILLLSQLRGNNFLSIRQISLLIFVPQIITATTSESTIVQSRNLDASRRECS